MFRLAGASQTGEVGGNRMGKAAELPGAAMLASCSATPGLSALNCKMRITTESSAGGKLEGS